MRKNIHPTQLVAISSKHDDPAFPIFHRRLGFCLQNLRVL